MTHNTPSATAAGPAHGEQEKPNVYLCQVGESLSCGACCGLYNMTALSRERLESVLGQRTALFADVPRTIDAIDDFQMKNQGRSHRERPFPRFHHCAFLGLIGDGEKRVGCLLHPEAPGNNGIDWRGLSYYGGMACRTYFCPSHRHLPEQYLTILQQSIAHWYLYGLIVTERQLIASFFTALERRIGKPLVPADVPPGSPAAGLVEQFARLKLDWPYRPASAPGPCHYLFENGEYPRPPVTRATDVPVSKYETIFRELTSAFTSIQALRVAEARIDRLLEALSNTILTQGGAHGTQNRHH